MDAAEAGDHGRVAVVEGDTGAGVEAGDGGFERLKDLAAQLDGTTVTIAADVTDRDTLVAAADQVEQQLGGADVLVNNAGVMLLGPFGSTQREETRRMVEVNLLGP
jgi:NADP-dependent 3-hydroxy acid dehydrogenase YdfG